MAVAITASLAGATDPQSVQLAVTGLTVGVPFTVTGATGDGWTWTVPGGNGQSASGTSVVLADPLTPLNLALTYTVEQGGDTATSTPVTVGFDGRYAMVSADGQTVVRFAWHDTRDEREELVRVAEYDVPGRTSALTVWDVSAGDVGEMLIRTAPADATALRDALRRKAPIFVVRTDGAVADFDPVQVIALRSVTNQLWATNSRLWRLTFRTITNPEPSLVLAASTWADFDAVYAALTGADFDAEWATLTGDDFDVTDWSTR